MVKIYELLKHKNEGEFPKFSDFFNQPCQTSRSETFGTVYCAMRTHTGEVVSACLISVIVGRILFKFSMQVLLDEFNFGVDGVVGCDDV